MIKPIVQYNKKNQLQGKKNNNKIHYAGAGTSIFWQTTPMYGNETGKTLNK